MTVVLRKGSIDCTVNKVKGRVNGAAASTDLTFEEALARLTEVVVELEKVN